MPKSRNGRRYLLRLGFFALGLQLIGCAPNGDDRFNRLQSLQGIGHDFEVHFLSPPWTVAEHSAERIRLMVAPNAAAVTEIDAGLGKFDLVITVVDGGIFDVFETQRALAVSRGESVLDEGASVQAATDGTEFIVFNTSALDSRFRRYAIYPLRDADEGRSALLSFSGSNDLRTEEVDQMCRDFLVRGER